MKHTYTKPTLKKVILAANDILLTSGEEPTEHGVLDDFDTASAQYQKKSWEEFFSN